MWRVGRVKFVGRHLPVQRILMCWLWRATGRFWRMSKPEPPKLLILGGTREAADLALQADVRWGSSLTVITSLAGRTAAPAEIAGQVRSGGFGGADAMAAYLETENIAAVIDATHPFAAQISANAAAAFAPENPSPIEMANRLADGVPADCVLCNELAVSREPVVKLARVETPLERRFELRPQRHRAFSVKGHGILRRHRDDVRVMFIRTSVQTDST